MELSWHCLVLSIAGLGEDAPDVRGEGRGRHTPGQDHGIGEDGSFLSL